MIRGVEQQSKLQSRLNSKKVWTYYTDWSLEIPALHREMEHAQQPMRNGVLLNYLIFLNFNTEFLMIICGSYVITIAHYCNIAILLIIVISQYCSLLQYHSLL